MKKLIIALTLVLVAAIGNAATVKWASGTVKTVGDETGAFSSSNVTATDITGYLFTLTASSYATYSADLDSIYTDWKAGTLVAKTDNVASAVSRGALTITESNVSSGSDVTVYAAVLYTTTFGGNEYYIANVGSQVVALDTTYTVANLATNIGGAANSTWTAAPEPTSGLLLLMGLAGLALKRKRA